MITNLAQAIMTKFNETPGSDDLRAAMTGGLWFTEAKDPVVFPYGVFTWNGSSINEQAGDRTSAIEIASITVSLFSKGDDGGVALFDIVQKFIEVYDWTTLTYPGSVAFRIQNTSVDATSAFVQVTSSSIILSVTGGLNDGSNSLTLSNYATLTDLYTAISGLSKGWVVVPVSNSGADPTELHQVSSGCLNSLVDVRIFGEYTHLACERTSATNRGKIDNVWVIDLDYDIWYEH
jgi:hypothetical protein